jgi:hypothetical protein
MQGTVRVRLLVVIAFPGVEGPRDAWRILDELAPRPERLRDRSKRLVEVGLRRLWTMS